MFLKYTVTFWICSLTIIIGSYGQDNVILESPRVTNWGEWGPWEMCPQFEYVYTFRLKVEGNNGEFEDDSAMNGIEMECISPQLRGGEGIEAAILRSSVGGFGLWRTLHECRFPYFANGFELRSERRAAVDNTAANNFRLVCSNGEVVEGRDGESSGEWTGQLICPQNQYVCGLRTQIEVSIPFPGDNTSLNNIDLACCNMPDKYFRNFTGSKY